MLKRLSLFSIAIPILQGLFLNLMHLYLACDIFSLLLIAFYAAFEHLSLQYLVTKVLASKSFWQYWQNLCTRMLELMAKKLNVWRTGPIRNFQNNRI